MIVLGPQRAPPGASGHPGAMAALGQTSRWVDVKGGSNVRDLGGLPLRVGGHTAYGVLWRSDTLQELTRADAQGWRSRGLRLVVDLRAPGEVAAEGRGPLADAPEVAYVNAPLIPDAAILPADDDEVVVHDRDRHGQVKHYQSYLRGEGARQVVAAVSALSQTTPAVFHCAAGKDRTGVLAALILSAVGVERAAVVADYAATAERLPGVSARLRRLPTYGPGLVDVPDSDLVPRAATMAELLDRLDAEHGGAAGWLRSAGVTDEELGRLRRRLVRSTAAG